MDRQPILTGNRLKLRPLKPDDYSAVFQAASDPLIWEQHPFPNRYKKEVFDPYFAKRLESGGSLVIIDCSSNEVIGLSSYYDFKKEVPSVVIGFTFLTRKYWGGSYNRELKTLMLDHAFQFATEVLFEVGERNLRSQKAMEKIGGILINKIQKTLENGDIIFNYIYRIRRDEYLRGPLAVKE